VSSTSTEIFVFALTAPSLSDPPADDNPAGTRAVRRIPSEFNPQVVIEAKLTEDNGTARDKVTGARADRENNTLDQRFRLVISRP
jgi:hypothetical protein